MRIINLNNSTIEFLADAEGEFTVKDVRQYKFAGYYFLSMLKDAGLVELKGVKDNNERIWSLTEKGQKLSECLREARRIITEAE
jgi:hypothetical protein